MHSSPFLRNMNVPEFFRWTAEFFCGFNFQFFFITGFRRKEQREALGFFDGCGQNSLARR